MGEGGAETELDAGEQGGEGEEFDGGWARGARPGGRGGGSEEGGAGAEGVDGGSAGHIFFKKKKKKIGIDGVTRWKVLKCGNGGRRN